MALVAYGSSDESDFSEEEENVAVPVNSVKNSESTASETLQNVNNSHTSTPDTGKQVDSAETNAKVPTPTEELLNVNKTVEEETDETLQISDEEDFLVEQSGPLTGLNLPAPKNTVTNGSSQPAEATTSGSNLLAGTFRVLH